jgi:hypothetical protein
VFKQSLDSRTDDSKWHSLIVHRAHLCYLQRIHRSRRSTDEMDQKALVSQPDDIRQLIPR